MGSAVYSYGPGGALAICGTRVAALVDLPPDAGLVPGLYELIGGDSAGLDEVLELLVSPGLRAVEHFALAEYTEDGLRTVVRGRYRAQAGSHTIEGRGLWTDRIVQADGYALLDPGTAGEGALPIAGGVVLAGRLQRHPGNAPVAPRVAAPVSSPAEPPGHPASPPRVAAEDAPAPLPARAPTPAPAQAAIPVPAPVPAPVSVPAPVPTAPVLAVEPSSEVGTGHTLPTPFTHPITDLPPPPSPPSASDQPTFIDSLPWSSPAPDDASPAAPPGPAAAPHPPAGAPPGPAAAPGGDEASERTISRDQLPRVGAQTVVAARCPAGHLSPAYAGTCRVCGQPLPAQQPVEIPRPPLGVLRLSNGDTVVLDRGCILGRNPRVPAGHSGEQPNLVKLIDPDKDISGQHLEVRLEYWHVAVKDLGSTNGTQVVLPGENPVTLRPNDPVMIEPGSKVILAGVFSFTFEVTP